jgi:hypothetical protein
MFLKILQLRRTWFFEKRTELILVLILRDNLMKNMNYYVFWAFVCLCVSMAQAEGWKMPDLNPFNNNEAVKQPATQKSWLPSFTKKAPAANNSPSVWKKVQGAPASMARGTKNALNSVNPFKKDETTVTKSNPYPTGLHENKPAEKKSWFGMGAAQPDKGPPTTVSDWMSQPRPE